MLVEASQKQCPHKPEEAGTCELQADPTATGEQQYGA